MSKQLWFQFEGWKECRLCVEPYPPESIIGVLCNICHKEIFVDPNETRYYSPSYNTNATDFE